VSLDRRLREELQRDAERVVPDVERNLGAVEARAHQRASVGSPALLGAAVVIAIAMAWRFGASPPPTGGPGSSGAVTSSPSPFASTGPTYDAIAGTYVVTLDPANSAVSNDGLGGRWTMRLASSGEIFLSPPASFGAGTSPLTGLAFSLTADRFRSNIFYNDYCSSIGTYTWTLKAGRLSFATVDDGCSIRQTLLSTAPWESSQ
jgi:hypothetical protein